MSDTTGSSFHIGWVDSNKLIVELRRRGKYPPSEDERLLAIEKRLEHIEHILKRQSEGGE